MAECEHGFNYGCPNCAFSEFMADLECAAKRLDDVGMIGEPGRGYYATEEIYGRQDAETLYRALIAQQEKIKELEARLLTG